MTTPIPTKASPGDGRTAPVTRPAATGETATTDAVPAPPRRTGRGPRRAQHPSSHRRAASAGLVAAIVVVSLVVLWALVPGLFAPGDPLSGAPAQKLLPPSPAHWFGTDALGRDLFDRVVHGAVQSLSGALIAVTVGFALGTVLGVLAGSLGGVIDDVLMRMVDVLLAIPGLLLSLSVIILLGFGTVNAALAVGLGSVAAFARLMRAEVVRVRRTEYVEAAFGSGATLVAVLRRHVLPNALGPVLALAALQFGAAILALATLGFLGYGAPPPTPEWGLLIAEGRDHVATSWWLTALPGLVVVAAVLSANRIGHALAGRSS